MSDATQRRKEAQTRTSFPYLLRLLFALAVILSFSAILIVAHLAMYMTSADLFTSLAFVMLFSVMGRTFDKKLAFWSFRFYKWLINHGFIEVLESDLDQKI